MKLGGRQAGLVETRRRIGVGPHLWRGFGKYTHTLSTSTSTPIASLTGEITSLCLVHAIVHYFSGDLSKAMFRDDTAKY